MNKQILLYLAFGAMVVLQLLLPAQTAFQFEQTLRKGEAFRFEVALVDPNDPFRGKYIRLDYPNLRQEISSYENSAELEQLTAGQTVYCSVQTDPINGYAQITALSSSPPQEDTAYFPAKVDYRWGRQSERKTLRLSYPFDRFYLEESKAPAAEIRYNEAVRDTLQSSYALVKIRGGMAVLEDVILNGNSIQE